MSRTWNSLRWIERAEPDNARPNAKEDMPLPDEFRESPVWLQPVGKPAGGSVESSGSTFCLERVPSVDAGDVSRIVGFSGPTTPAADRFRLLRMRLRSLRSIAPLKTILVTSPLPQDGKSTVSMNLAMALTEKGSKKVLLIDFDLHRGSASEQLHLDDISGVSECLQSNADPLALIRRVDPFGFYALSRGNCSSEIPSELLLPSAVTPLFSAIAPEFDLVVVDSPPVLPLTDALSLAQCTDGTLLVARAGKTPTKAVEEAIELLGRKSLVGVLLNGTDDGRKGYYNYKSYYRNRK